MTCNVTGKSCKRAKVRAALAAAGLALTATPAMAQDDVSDREPDLIDAAMTPLTDLNLARDPIPAVLIAARSDPYANRGMADCAAILSGIGDLDAVLGDDYDTRVARERRLTPGGVAQRAVGMFIPFRGIIRELSGANNHEFEFREAIVAGQMRRAYLKGLGEARGCPYPARPATPDMVARLDADAQPQHTVATAMTGDGDDTVFVSRAIVQPTAE
ncbi:MAG: hypothetical protein JY451_15120 [Erythrobacter sp.]|nr:MAG: hypothetical protein JY451_15120 [Erythrobacter sp.]